MDRDTAVLHVRHYFRFLSVKGKVEIPPISDVAVNSAGWIIRAHSSEFDIRLVLDKGQVFAELGPRHRQGMWCDERLLLSFLTKGGTTPEYLIPDGPITNEDIEDQIASLADMIRKEHNILTAFFRQEGHKARMLEFTTYKRDSSNRRWTRLLK